MAVGLRRLFKQYLLIIICFVIITAVYLCADHFLTPNVHTVNRFIAATVRPGFDIRPPFSFPDPKYIRPVEEVARMKWVHELADILAKKTNKIVYLTSVDKGYFVTLLNWLVAVDLNTNIDINDIIVLSFDKTTYDILKMRSISTIYVKMEELINHHFVLAWASSSVYFWDVGITRIAVVRLMNHWGYDVSVIDLDAIPLKDISPLFEKYSDSDIVGSHSFAKILGICFGFVLFRSTPRNGMSQQPSNIHNCI